MVKVDRVARLALKNYDEEEDENLYLKMKELRSKLEMMEIQ